MEQTYIKVENLRTKDVVIDDLDVDSALGHDLEEIGELGTTNTVGAIHNKLTLRLSGSRSASKGLRHLLIVTLLANLAVGLGGAFGVDATGQVVKLGGGKNLVVGVVGVCGLESIGKSSNEGVAGGTSITTVDNSTGRRKVDLELGGQSLVVVEKLLIRRRVDELGSKSLPLLLEHLTHGVNDLDTIVDSWVVTGSDHDTNGLAIELTASQTGQKTNTERNTIEKVGLHTEPRSAIVVDMVGHDRVLGRSGEELFVRHSTYSCG